MTASKDAQEDQLVRFLYHILNFPESWVKRESVGLKSIFSSCFEQHFVEISRPSNMCFSNKGGSKMRSI
jgi:hypothetical protein